MKKNRQTDRLRIEKIRGKGPEEIFNKNAQKHDSIVHNYSKLACDALKKEHPYLEFRFREKITKKEINDKLNNIDERLGVTLIVGNASIKPDGGILEVKDDNGNWRVVLVSEAKHQGKDIENISKGILVGKNKDQTFMIAGNAIERSHKNINEFRNFMIGEKHFPYILFLQGSNFLTETIKIQTPDGTEIILQHDVGSLNRIDRLTAANYSLPINKNSCENIIIKVDNQMIMLQAVSIFTKPREWTSDEMLPIMVDIANTSLRVLGLTT